MAELDQHLPTTSTFHRPTMEEAVVKMKRIQRFTRQFSIFVHCEDENGKKILSSKTEKPAAPKKDENNEDRLFKYPGDLRAVKRKRNPTTPSVKNVSIGAKRKMMEHQKSIREADSEGPPEIAKEDNDKEKEEEEK
ncbi:hypothetical protein GCK72_023892 [Caenorhabditis remanei]|uniref:Uncharacterized protein n=1 Tax=Caenorhabditis remanei TaxID=31234 RepID=E3M2J0_CAERE|nr:hypothetical protein GCK72_023892 [Caenorhabditis remanei]EFO89734.1 hypothetical protein CRE_07368 [Caenorhabditis remanei]KAF1747430.1 hypothetical protein GCK72_023892 [Caenorhabditis remanei]